MGDEAVIDRLLGARRDQLEAERAAGLAARRAEEIPQLKRPARAAVARFVHICDRLATLVTHPVSQIIDHLLSLSGYLDHLESSSLEEDQQRVVESWLRHFESGIKPRLEAMPHRAVHGDFNPANLIVDLEEPDRLVGIVDFGDMHSAPTVVDVAIAAAYQCLDSENPAAPLAAAAAAYHAVAPLTAEEAGIAADLAITRLVQSLLVSS